jgi:hypothetical protein
MSDLKEKGVVKQILKVESGTSKAGKEWSKQEFIIETLDSQYPKNICFTLFGDKTDLLQRITEGMTVEVYFNLESREYNERWYHSVNAWRIQPEEVQQNEHVETTGDLPKEFEAPPKVDDSGADDSDNLPF